MTRTPKHGQIESPGNSFLAPEAPHAPNDNLPPDAAARDAAKRAEVPVDDTVDCAKFEFVTHNVTETEKAAVAAVLTSVRAEETKRVKHVERIEHEPWRRAQRVSRSIGDLLDPS
ncbi:MAG: hypothetical protein ACTHV4_06985 [Canibacter sp.]